ncbi:PKD domain-containing protein, partial [Candidatus Roizmanbacteria bacterium]|nr:PKD domain-containing protein [Candidatus Roizmanbacteria bacterium]
TTYSWNFGDGSTANISSLSHTYTTPGTYTVTLSVADASGSSKQATIVITASAVQPPPDPTLPPDAVISTSPAVGNAPFTVQFDGSGSTATEPPIDSYSWDFGDGGTAEGVTASHTYSIPGDYYASLTVVDNIGQIGITSTPVKVNIGPGSDNQPPTASFTATPVSGAPPILVTFIASTSSDPDGTISQYQWNFGDGSLATGITAQHTFIGIAEYTVSLTVTDNLGKTAVTTKTVSVGAPGEKERNAAKAILPIIYQLLME